MNAAGAGQGNGVAAAAIDDPIGNPYQNYQNDLFDPSKWVDNTQAGNNQRYLDNTLPFAQFLEPTAIWAGLHGKPAAMGSTVSADAAERSVESAVCA